MIVERIVICCWIAVVYQVYCIFVVLMVVRIHFLRSQLASVVEIVTCLTKLFVIVCSMFGYEILLFGLVALDLAWFCFLL